MNWIEFRSLNNEGAILVRPKEPEYCCSVKLLGRKVISMRSPAYLDRIRIILVIAGILGSGVGASMIGLSNNPKVQVGGVIIIAVVIIGVLIVSLYLTIYCRALGRNVPSSLP